MGKQYNKVLKRKRRHAYLERKEAAKKTAALTAPRPKAAPAAAGATSAPAAKAPAKKAPAKKKAPAEKADKPAKAAGVAPDVASIPAPQTDADTVSSAPTNPEPADISTTLSTSDPLPDAAAETVAEPAAPAPEAEANDADAEAKAESEAPAAGI